MPEPRTHRKSAFNLALQEAQGIAPVVLPTQQHSETVAPSHSDIEEVSLETPGTPPGDTVKPLHSETVQPSQSITASPISSAAVEPLQGKEEKPFQSNTVIQQDSSSVKREQVTEKVTFYLTIEQVNKLDDLAHDYKKRRGKRINRNDIVRYLIDQCTLDALESM